MSSHIVIDQRCFGHLVYELPWWREKCRLLNVQLHAPDRPILRRPSCRRLDKADMLLRCNESIFPAPLGRTSQHDHCDEDRQLHDIVEELAHSTSVGNVLLLTSNGFGERHPLLLNPSTSVNR